MVTALGQGYIGLAAERDEFTATHDIPNGSSYYEMDGTHRVFMWDKQNKRWLEQ